MPETRVLGLNELRARLEAIKPNQRLMELLAEKAVAEQHHLSPYATGNLRHSIHIGAVTPTRAETVADAHYAAYVEDGMAGGTIIRPVKAKALRWASDRGAARLSGAPRSSGAGSGVIFSKKVTRGATKAQPFMMPGAKRAVTFLADIVVRRWNESG